MSDEINWSPSMMVEVTLKEPDDFLKVRETLTRIGVASRKEKKAVRKFVKNKITLQNISNIYQKYIQKVDTFVPKR